VTSGGGEVRHNHCLPLEPVEGSPAVPVRPHWSARGYGSDGPLKERLHRRPRSHTTPTLTDSFEVFFTQIVILLHTSFIFIIYLYII